jgi:hypothetical protein
MAKSNKTSTLHRIRQSAQELNQSLSEPPAPGLCVFNAKSIQRLDALACEIVHTSGNGRITIEISGGPGKGYWRFDEIALRLDSEAARQAQLTYLSDVTN